MILKNLHLILSLIVVVPAAFIYGIMPDKSLPLLFTIEPEGTDFLNMLRGIMGLYLGLSLLWGLGIFRSEFWMTASWSNLVFMLGMGLGRCLSLLLDGIPSPLFLWGTFGELILGIYAAYQLHKHYLSLS